MPKRGRLLAVVVAAAVIAAPLALDACVFSCAAAATTLARIGAPPCHHHAGHHATVDGQNTAQASKRALASGDLNASVSAGSAPDPLVDAPLIANVDASPISPPRAQTPLRI